MKHAGRKVVLPIAVWAAAVTLVPAVEAARAPEAASVEQSVEASESDVPFILPLPTTSPASDEALTVQARVTSRTGIGKAVLWVRGETDRVYRAVPMSSVDNDTFSARLTAWPSRGKVVRYYVEAWNALGTERRRAGDPTTPFVAQIVSPAAVKSLGTGPNAWWKLGILGAVFAASQIGFRVRRRRSRADEERSRNAPKSKLAYHGVDSYEEI